MSWQSIYQSYDEDALCVFANPGLVRRARKDVEAGKVSLEQQDDNQGQFLSDGQQVCLPATGINQAQCNCPANGACKHILASILWLQENSHSSDEHKPTPIDPLQDLLALDSLSLCKSVGIANVRMAYQLCHDWQQALEMHVSGNQLKISLPNISEPIIYLAQAGFAGIISDLPSRQQQALHLAAVARLFGQHQRNWQWPEAAIPEDKKNLPLNNDELALIQRIEQNLLELLEQGLSHISQSTATQLHMLNMSARAEGFPQLAAMLRSLSQQAQLLANRHFALEERDVLFLMARLAAYLHSLKQADIDTLSQLRGRPRRSYESQDSVLNLVPLGARWWNSNTGAHGATLVFWDRDNQAYLECTNARTNNMDASFSRLNVWQVQNLWRSTPQLLMQQPFALHQPRLSADNKLAFTADSYCQLQPALDQSSYSRLIADTGFANFAALQQYIQQQNSSEQGLPFNLMLHIAGYDEAYLDEVQQCIVWPVYDSHKNYVFLRLMWDDFSRLRIEKLEQVLAKKPKVCSILVSPNQQDQHVELQPFSLLIEDDKKATIHPLCLDFELPKRFISKLKGNFVNRIVAFIKQKKIIQQSSYSQPSASLRITRPLLACLESQACSGRKMFTQSQKEVLAQCQADAQQLGLQLLATSLERLYQQQRPVLPQLLSNVYLCYILQQMQCSLPIVLAKEQ